MGANVQFIFPISEPVVVSTERSLASYCVKVVPHMLFIAVSAPLDALFAVNNPLDIY